MPIGTDVAVSGHPGSAPVVGALTVRAEAEMNLRIACRAIGGVFLSLLFGFSPSAAGLAAEEGDSATGTQTDLLSGIREGEEALRAFSVISHFNIQQMMRIGGADRAAPEFRETTRSDTVHFTVDARGRGRCEAEGNIPSGIEEGGQAPRRLVKAFDGTVTRRMSGRTAYVEGHVSAGDGNLFEPCNPREFVTHYFGEPVSHILSTSGFTVVGQANHYGRSVLLVETNPTTGYPEVPDVQQKYIFLIDEERHFQIVKKALAFRYPGHEWTERSQFVVKESIQDRSGVWLPVQLQLEVSGFPMKPDVAPRLLYRFSIRNEQWDLAPRCDDSVFFLEFAPGVCVTDEVTHTSYRVAGATDETCAGQCAAAESRPASGPRWIIAANVALLCAAAVAALLIVARRRGKRGGEKRGNP
jgi:hypothetical protein